jgi:RND family efflux transporter MFP subunit
MKQKLKHITISGLVIVAICLLVFFRILGKSARAAQAGEPSLRPVAVALVQRRAIVNSLTLSGTFRPYQEVDVHAKVAGYIRQIFVDVGDKVRQGQVLAILEVPELTAQILGAEATIQHNQDSIRRAQSEIERSESAHSAAHLAYTRLKQASEARPGLIAEQELDDALAKDKEAEAQVDSAKAALAEAQSQLSVSDASRKQLVALEAYTRITAPFGGVITKRYADTGALIQAGTASNTQAMPVVRLAEWSRLRLVVPVPESAVSQIHMGSAVQVRVAALNRSFEGRVARFADALEQQTRTMQTEIDVENLDGTLVDGMYAETRLTLSKKDAALTLPIQSVQREGSRASVLLVDHDGRIEERQVKLGVEGNDRIEILSGLAEKDQVVIGNRSEFTPGEKVQPKRVDEPAGNAEAGS